MDLAIMHSEAAGKLRNSLLRKDFERAYRTPGVKYMGAACALGACAVLSYYLLDVFHTRSPWTGGAQTVRIFLASTCALVATLCFTLSLEQRATTG